MEIMLDLETMGTNENAAIVSIGAVAFSRDGLGPAFYTVIDFESNETYGLSVNLSTVKWWMNQSAEARSAFSSHNVDLKEALLDFTNFINSIGKSVRVWGNGADFDNAILANAYTKTGLPRPWPFWNNMCFRTLKNLFPHIKPEERTGAHNALADAKYQAQHAIKILSMLQDKSAL